MALYNSTGLRTFVVSRTGTTDQIKTLSISDIRDVFDESSGGIAACTGVYLTLVDGLQNLTLP